MLEANLINNTVDQLPHLLDLSDNYISSREIPAGRRYIDIVYVELNDELKSNPNIVSKVASLNSNQLSVLAYFVDGKRKTKHLILNNFYFSWQSVFKNYLKIFIKKGLIEQVGEKTFFAPDLKKIIPKRVISVEAKINDWKSVLKQARYNTKYSSESYVLVPSDLSSRLNNKLALFREKNIGIFVSNDSYEVDSTYLPKYKAANDGTHSSDFMKLSLLKNYYLSPSKWQ